MLLASLAHTLGGGTPPGPATIALSLAFAGPFAILLVGSRHSTARAGVAAVAAQLVLHGLYSLTAGESAVGISLVPSHRHSVDHSNAASLVSGPATSAAAHDESFGPGMLLTHVIAAALTVAAIVWADQVLESLRVAARGILLAWILVATPIVRPSVAHRAPAAEPVVAPNGVERLLPSLRRRGPPRRHSAALAATH